MAYTISDIEQLALANLSNEERNILAGRLWQTTSDDMSEPQDDPEFLAEIERRAKSVRDGTATLHSKDDVDAYLKQKYGWS